MRTLNFSILIILLVTVQFASAQTEQSLLWEISGKGLKQSSYLYGTIHIQDKRVFAFDSVVHNAFNSCDAYAMELVLDEIDPKDFQSTMIMKDHTLSDLLSKEDYNKLDAYFKEKTGSGILMYDKMKPFMVYSQLSQSGIKQDMELALDAWFLDKARKSGKSIHGIEKLSDQLGAIDKISLEDQCEMLMSYISDTTGIDMESEMDIMIGAYLEHDLAKMEKLTTDTALPENFAKAFLIDRNVRMAKKIEKLSKKQSTFNAIGAAHLGGKDGVVALLRKKGYTVKAVPFTFVQE